MVNTVVVGWRGAREEFITLPNVETKSPHIELHNRPKTEFLLFLKTRIFYIHRVNESDHSKGNGEMNSLNLNRCRMHPSHTRSSSTTEREEGSSELVSNILNKSFRLVCECLFTIPRKRLENYSVLVYDGMCSSQQHREFTVRRRKSFQVGGNKISDDRGTSSTYRASHTWEPSKVVWKMKK